MQHNAYVDRTQASYEFSQRERRAHPHLVTDAQVAEHIRAEHADEYSRVMAREALERSKAQAKGAPAAKPNPVLEAMRRLA